MVAVLVKGVVGKILRQERANRCWDEALPATYSNAKDV